MSQTKSSVSNFSTVQVWNGVVYGQTAAGDLHQFVLASHDAINLTAGI